MKAQQPRQCMKPAFQGIHRFQELRDRAELGLFSPHCFLPVPPLLMLAKRTRTPSLGVTFSFAASSSNNRQLVGLFEHQVNPVPQF